MASRENKQSGNAGDGNAGDYIDPSIALGGDGDASGGGSDGGIATDGNGNIFDPSIHIGPDKLNSDGSFRRKRGRKAGNGGGNRPKKVPSDIEEIAHILSASMVMLHATIANATKTPEWMISAEEANYIASSGLNFLAQFDVRPNPKVTAGIAFGGAIIGVYGTRIAAIKMRKENERKEKSSTITDAAFDPTVFDTGN